VKQLITSIVQALVDKPDEVQIKEVIGEHAHVLELSVAKEDLGKVIGKGGAILGSRILLPKRADSLAAPADPLLGSADQVRVGPLHADRPIRLRCCDARHPIVVDGLGSPTRRFAAIDSELCEPLKCPAASLAVSWRQCGLEAASFAPETVVTNSYL